MSKQSVPPVVSNSQIEDYLNGLSPSDAFDVLLSAGRLRYEEAKIKHNLDPKRYPFANLERLRVSLENLERSAPEAKSILARLEKP